MNISAPKKVAQYGLFTLDGKPLYNRGYRGHTLTKEAHSLQSTTLDPLTKLFNIERLARAAMNVSEPVEWRRIEDAEIMNVSF